MQQTHFVLLLLTAAAAAAPLHDASTPRELHQGPDPQCPLKVKILDAVQGTPAGSVVLKVHRRATSGTWTQVAAGVTDDTGEVHGLISEQQFPAGVYRVEFDTKTYWKSRGAAPFHEAVDVSA
ncbi:unnamed protein product [Lampetra planeri]